LRAIFQGEDLTPATRVDFGIDSPAHFLALRNAVLTGKVDAPELDAALGHGEELTKMVNRLHCNPDRVVFKTSYDELFKQYQRDRAGERGAEAPSRKHGRDYEPGM
jgi:hypothetical protein